MADRPPLWARILGLAQGVLPFVVVAIIAALAVRGCRVAGPDDPAATAVRPSPVRAELQPAASADRSQADRPRLREVPFCGRGERITCVVDGDTFWWEGEKIRVAGIDAPEIGGRCHAEMVLAADAAELVRTLLETNEVTIVREGEDRYGRTLARIEIGPTTLTDALTEAAVARPWRGSRETWC